MSGHFKEIRCEKEGNQVRTKRLKSISVAIEMDSIRQHIRVRFISLGQVESWIRTLVFDSRYEPVTAPCRSFPGFLHEGTPNYSTSESMYLKASFRESEHSTNFTVLIPELESLEHFTSPGSGSCLYHGVSDPGLVMSGLPWVAFFCSQSLDALHSGREPRPGAHLGSVAASGWKRRACSCNPVHTHSQDLLDSREVLDVLDSSWCI